MVKGINFLNLRDAGDPIEAAVKYNNSGADEFVLLDITASYEDIGIMVDIVRSFSQNIFILFTVGGGISRVEGFFEMLNAGMDKVSVNYAAVKSPDIINEASYKFGSQCFVIAIYSKKSKQGKYEVYINGGRDNTGIDDVEWAMEAQSRGAGEILLTSMDCDGIKDGYDIGLTKAISESV